MEEREGGPRSNGVRDEQSICNWLVDYLSKTLGRERQDVLSVESFESLGLDSITAAGMVGDLSTWIGWDVDLYAAYSHPNVRSLAGYLATECARRADSSAAS